MDTETGEFQEKRLAHREDAETFYRALAGQKVRVGMEASGHARWFERLLAELQFELWIGDAAEIQSKRVRKQKTDRQDAQLILRLMLKDDFPRIWVQMFVRERVGIEIFSKLVEQGLKSDVFTRVGQLEQRYRLKCPVCKKLTRALAGRSRPRRKNQALLKSILNRLRML